MYLFLSDLPPPKARTGCDCCFALHRQQHMYTATIVAMMVQMPATIPIIASVLKGFCSLASLMTGLDEPGDVESILTS